MAKRRAYSSTVSVDIDIADIIHQMDDDDLINECEARDIATAKPTTDTRDELYDALMALRAGRLADADATLERILWPKFPTLDACKVKYANAIKSKSEGK
jgi:hypothetical protein